MAATATVIGRFAARAGKTWDSFTDNRTGETVPAGRSLVLYVVTDGDDALETIKVPGEHVAAAETATAGLKFGDRCELAVISDKYGLKFVRRVDVPAAPLKSAS